MKLSNQLFDQHFIENRPLFVVKKVPRIKNQREEFVTVNCLGPTWQNSRAGSDGPRTWSDNSRGEPRQRNEEVAEMRMTTDTMGTLANEILCERQEEKWTEKASNREGVGKNKRGGATMWEVTGLTSTTGTQEEEHTHIHVTQLLSMSIYSFFRYFLHQNWAAANKIISPVSKYC